ncbi:MAG: GNAT family N-acetyltransferase, partial [Woeseiaceae bacterium]|nr:GNAT family N-acetyltransferase [Woeseiaceae bacterium]
MDVTIRDVRASDLDAVLELNEAVVPDVNSLSIADLQWFADSAHYFRIAHAGDRFASFLIGMRPGTDYASPNYRWFVENYDDFGYIDRIAVAEHARR